MATPQQLEFLTAMYQAAYLAAVEDPDVPWRLEITPEDYAAAAACESCVETGWGAHMPPNSNNVLGIKAYSAWDGKVVSEDGTEQNKDGSWTGPQPDLWCVFDSPEDCFDEQLMILCEPRYARAAEATTVEGYDMPNPENPDETIHVPGYIELECAVWSTGQAKGALVLQIYHAHASILQPSADVA